MNCNKCPEGFVEPVEEIWELIGLFEKYGMEMFIDTNITMNGPVYNVNTTAISNVLIAEHYKDNQYTEMFNDMCIFLSSGIERRYTDISKLREMKKK